jgi:hypothetical protein
LSEKIEYFPLWGADLKIILLALLFAVAWTAALAMIAHSPGLHSTPGAWAGAVGLPGVVIANWTQSAILHNYNRAVGYGIMFVVNWIFYCSVILGVVSVKRSLLD